MSVAAKLKPIAPSPELVASIKRAEGLRLKAYADPESELARTGKGSGEPWSIGYGHTGPDVHEGLVWTQAQAEAALLADLAAAAGECDRCLAWWRTLDAPRRDVIWELMFNLGWGGGVRGLSTFKASLALIQGRQFSKAAAELVRSRWSVQVKSRATRLAQQLASGVYAP